MTLERTRIDGYRRYIKERIWSNFGPTVYFEIVHGKRYATLVVAKDLKTQVKVTIFYSYNLNTIMQKVDVACNNMRGLLYSKQTISNEDNTVSGFRPQKRRKAG